MKIDIAKARARTGSRSSKPFDEPCQSKTRRRLGHAAGLTQFGVNHWSWVRAPAAGCTGARFRCRRGVTVGSRTEEGVIRRARRLC